MEGGAGVRDEVMEDWMGYDMRGREGGDTQSLEYLSVCRGMFNSCFGNPPMRYRRCIDVTNVQR